MTFDTFTYWNQRYQKGRGSGAGSRQKWAARKAAYINALIVRENVDTVIDWGCGDGNVACRFQVAQYVGLDISEVALGLSARICGFRAGWSWCLYDGLTAPACLPPADLALSLDIIYHLVDDTMYQRHLELLFGAAPLVCINASNRDEYGHSHVRHREFLRDIPPAWTLIDQAQDGRPGEISMWLFRKDAP